MTTARYRAALPQTTGSLFLSDGGIETTLIFHDGLELPDFAAFHLLKTAEGRAALLKYFRSYADIARRFGTGLILESATWRGSADWGARLGYTPEALADANRESILLLEQIRQEYENGPTHVVISGCVGPRGDGYVANSVMSVQQAENYHREEIETFAATAADMICAITMNYVEEAIGIARAAERARMPVVLSFTVETDGRLPTGQTLRAAIEQVEENTGGYPRYYMINCAHPSHFESVLGDEGRWLGRVRGLRANASRKSHAELNESPVIDIGDPIELGNDYARVKRRLRHLNVMGGCCGTDHRHIEQIASACLPLFGIAT
ncbi:MAG TPA: homocysteine S-methyltransferase family protein [Vicinamibacterales bacterium]|jgi:S-methylmethionine-dependent homocysteine/selenocysteine methylase|nr:homocysteine S-methyltransferase family protein [Vicinamibacterales bacterium]